ncbi:hypothetical protein HL658_22055 [Azospirillum sp. RWY-5-1]|uniref:Uncharacterized protein n=1 Tax=Azospirillum oleiclasticum TaxID=2735135 RepID=A0ABX2TAH1_9PROT|nr:hypothetical protein [Azospirillum oleiclasticum]NYZ15232.1 hypothetical protein [Azospirillum oleiclasticum]NYZ21347.1 hypothetical protein [Azospirillum oleiclasticum]
MWVHMVCASGTAGTVAGADRRLLHHGLGVDPATEHPVTVRHALEAAGLDPFKSARRLMTLPPPVARDDLAAVLRGFSIGDHRCPDPEGHAHAALTDAGTDIVPHPFGDPRFGLTGAALLALVLMAL